MSGALPAHIADAGLKAIWQLVHDVWQLLDDGETGPDGVTVVDQDRLKSVSKAMDGLEALVPDSERPFWGGFPVLYLWPDAARLKHLERRESDLLEANNRYLERARRAEAAIKHLQESLFWRAAARVDHTMPLLKAEIVAQIREEAELDIETMPDDEDPTTAHGLQLLCDWQDRARAADKAEKRDLEPAAEELQKTSAGVAAVVEESGGYWHACSGCYETEDGHPSQNYPHSRIFACQVGAGCSECGGLGAVWDDLSYVYEMVRDFLEEEKGKGRASCTVADDVEADCPVCGEPLHPSDMCLSDVDLGICHAACLEGSPVVSLDTGEPLPEGAPAPVPYRYGDI